MSVIWRVSFIQRFLFLVEVLMYISALDCISSFVKPKYTVIRSVDSLSGDESDSP